MKIYPSILEPNIESLTEYLLQLLPHFDHFQLDIADGIFVPNTTIRATEIIKAIQDGRLSLKDTTLEFHLMEENPVENIKLLNQNAEVLNLNSIIIHLEPYLKSHQSHTILSSHIPLGLSLNPDESINSNWEIIKNFPIIQLMTVYPGKQGSPFVPEVLKKITELREKGFKGQIILDGAMNDKTLPIVLKEKHLPDAICPGSYFKEDSGEKLKRLRTILTEGLLHENQL